MTTAPLSNSLYQLKHRSIDLNLRGFHNHQKSSIGDYVENRLKDDFNNVIEKRESKSITWADVVSNKNKSQKEENINEEDTNNNSRIE